jgi:hypothetical protein
MIVERIIIILVKTTVFCDEKEKQRKIPLTDCAGSGIISPIS